MSIVILEDHRYLGDGWQASVAEPDESQNQQWPRLHLDLWALGTVVSRAQSSIKILNIVFYDCIGTKTNTTQAGLKIEILSPTLKVWVFFLLILKKKNNFIGLCQHHGPSAVRSLYLTWSQAWLGNSGVMLRKGNWDVPCRSERNCHCWTKLDWEQLQFIQLLETRVTSISLPLWTIWLFYLVITKLLFISVKQQG